MYLTIGRPSQPENADYVEGTAQASKWKATIFFLLCPSSVTFLCSSEVIIVPDEDKSAKYSSDANWRKSAYEAAAKTPATYSA